MTRRQARLTLGLALLALAALPLAAEPAPDATFFLVRHAEKATAEGDPALTAEGAARAEDLARTLAWVELDAVWSSDTRRTRDTAAPVLADQELELELYSPFDLSALAEKLLAHGGRHLVVGHSNTTPTLAVLLGGRAGPEIDEATEFDRLYVLVRRGGETETVTLRYGEGPSASSDESSLETTSSR